MGVLLYKIIFYIKIILKTSLKDPLRVFFFTRSKQSAHAVTLKALTGD